MVVRFSLEIAYFWCEFPRSRTLVRSHCTYVSHERPSGIPSIGMYIGGLFLSSVLYLPVALRTEYRIPLVIVPALDQRV